MKKKIGILVFVLIFTLSSGIIIKNSLYKNYSVDKKIKMENTNDTTWQNDYVYKRDKKNKYLILSLYKGNDKDITVPAKAVIDGVELLLTVDPAQHPLR